MNQRLRVAIAEDEPFNLMRLARLLREQECEVVAEMQNGLAMLDWLNASGMADVLFLDIRMPGLSGLDLAQRVMQDRLPVVFVTAFPMYALDAFDVAAVDYLLKPVSNDRLVRTLDRIQPNRKRSTPPSAQGPFRYAVKAGEGYIFMSLTQTTHFEYKDGAVWAHANGYFRTQWRSLMEAEETLQNHGVLKAHRHVLIRPEAIIGLKYLDSGRLVLRLAGGIEVKVSRGCAPQIRARLGMD